MAKKVVEMWKEKRAVSGKSECTGWVEFKGQDKTTHPPINEIVTVKIKSFNAEHDDFIDRLIHVKADDHCWETLCGCEFDEWNFDVIAWKPNA